MNSLYRYLLKYICKKLVVQGFDHKQNIIEYYRIMQEAAENEFTEDNKPTLDGFLTDCHKEANNEILFQRYGHSRLR